MAVGLGEP